MLIEVISAFDLEPGAVFRSRLDADCPSFEVLSKRVNGATCTVRARRLNNSFCDEQTFLWNSRSFQVLLLSRAV